MPDPPPDLAPMLPVLPLRDGSLACRNGIRLTRHECELLDELHGDLPNKEIARRLGCSISAVEKSLQRVRRKTGLTRGRLILFWDYAGRDDGRS